MLSKIKSQNSKGTMYEEAALKVILFFTCSFFFFNSVVAQVPEDKDILLNGEGGGQAKFAELNGYPGPKHVLDLESTLQLTKSQKRQIEVIYQDMLRRAKELGKRIVYLEQELHNAFRDHFISEKSIEEKTDQLGKLRGRLRATHLTAHLKTEKLLTDEQIEMYKKMRSSKSK